MFSLIRKRFTYANVAMTLALVFAVSGGAYAASKYVITSTKQISPKVLKSLKGAKGANGANGAQGPQGLQGAAGAAGAKGETGAAGAKGETGAAGVNGEKGTSGTNGTSVTSTAIAAPACTNKEGGTEFTAGGTKTFACNGEKGVLHPGETLPSGATETGTWGLGYKVPAGEPVKRDAISFPIPLAKEALAPEENIIGVGEGQGEPGVRTPFPAGCKGNVSKPEAAKDNLCVFIGFAGGAGELKLTSILSPSNGVNTGTTGAILNFETKEGLALAQGTWAVTAE